MHRYPLRRLPSLSVALALLATAASAETTAANWALHCQKCHGADGSGKTPYGEKLAVRDYRTDAVQQSFTDEQALDAQRLGIKDSAGKLKMLPLADRLNEQEMRDLVAFVRKLRKP